MSESSWYYAKDGVQAGPVPITQLREMAGTGALRPQDLVWTEGMPEWRPASAVQAVYGAAPAYSQAGGYSAGAAPFTPGTAYAPGAATGGLNYYTPGYEPVYAGFWLRFCAVFIDGLIILVPVAVVGVAMFFALGLQNEMNNPNSNSVAPALLDLGVRLFALLVGWVYYAKQESGPHMATFGKRACGLVVTDTAGQRLTFGRASGRYFGKILSNITCYIGYIMAGFTQKRQALHDMVAGTLVVRK